MKRHRDRKRHTELGSSGPSQHGPLGSIDFHSS